MLNKTNLWKFLTINFKNKYFHNLDSWSGLYLQMYIPSRLANILRFTAFKSLENAFVKLPCPWYDLIINPPCRTVSQYIFPHKIVLAAKKSFQKKIPLYFKGRDTMSLLHWKIMRGALTS